MWVSSFGDLRIKGCYTPPRSLSQLRHVLHRLFVPRHPPYTLGFYWEPKKPFVLHLLTFMRAHAKRNRNICFVLERDCSRPWMFLCDLSIYRRKDLLSDGSKVDTVVARWSHLLHCLYCSWKDSNKHLYIFRYTHLSVLPPGILCAGKSTMEFVSQRSNRPTVFP